MFILISIISVLGVLQGIEHSSTLKSLQFKILQREGKGGWAEVKGEEYVVQSVQISSRMPSRHVGRAAAWKWD